MGCHRCNAAYLLHHRSHLTTCLVALRKRNSFFTQVVCWLCLLSSSLPLLLLLWFGHVIPWEDTSPVARSSGLDGYIRILPGVDQVWRGDESHTSFLTPKHYFPTSWTHCFCILVVLFYRGGKYKYQIIADFSAIGCIISVAFYLTTFYFYFVLF